MPAVTDVLSTVVRLLPVVWGTLASVGLMILFLGRLCDLSQLLPTADDMLNGIGKAVNGNDPAGECSLCGAVAQMLDNNIMPAYNPYYGVRTSVRTSGDELAKRVNSIFCSAEPCFPGCHGLADSISASVNTEAFNAFNRTSQQLRAMEAPASTFATLREHVVPAVITKDIHLLESRFTMMRSEERDYQTCVGAAYGGDQPASAKLAARHAHIYDARGICLQCGRVRAVSECKAGERYDMVRRFMSSRFAKGPKQPCPTCGIVQDLSAPRLTQSSRHGGTGAVAYSGFWFLQYPMNPETHQICYAYCEGRLGWRQRLAVRLYRFVVQHHVRERLKELFLLPRVTFFIAVVCYCAFFVGPAASINGNLMWRNTMHGIPVTSLETATAASVLNRSSRYNLPIGLQRARGRRL